MAQSKYWTSNQGACDISAVADEAMANTFMLLKIATDGDYGLADNATDNGMGVLQEEDTDGYASGDIIRVRIQGVSFVRISTGTINAGVNVTAAASGYAVAAGDGETCYAKTLAQASGVDSVVPAIILPGCNQVEDVV